MAQTFLQSKNQLLVNNILKETKLCLCEKLFDMPSGNDFSCMCNAHCASIHKSLQFVCIEQFMQMQFINTRFHLQYLYYSICEDGCNK